MNKINEKKKGRPIPAFGNQIQKRKHQKLAINIPSKKSKVVFESKKNEIMSIFGTQLPVE